MNIITAENLTKSFGEVRAVNGISFEVEEGELFGFLGVNGAGKSTVINMLATLLRPDGGKASVCGCDVERDADGVRRGIGVVWQQNCLDDLLTVRENLVCRGALYFADRQRIEERLAQVCGILELDEVLKRRYGKLSGGWKRRCEIAAALMHTPRVLFLDEPTTGLDPATRRTVWDAVERLRAEQGLTVFLTTHYMEEAASADHIVIIDKGQRVAAGTPFELKERYASDRLSIYDGDREELRRRLEKLGQAFEESESALTVRLRSTADALPLLRELEGAVGGFEVVQGTMDDVFLNACGQTAAANEEDN